MREIDRSQTSVLHLVIDGRKQYFDWRIKDGDSPTKLSTVSGDRFKAGGDLSAGSGSFDAFTSDMLAASGGGVHMVGSAADVAEQLIDAHRAGVSAAMLTFPEYLDDLHRFAREIQPTLIKADCIAAN